MAHQQFVLQPPCSGAMAHAPAHPHRQWRQAARSPLAAPYAASVATSWHARACPWHQRGVVCEASCSAALEPQHHRQRAAARAAGVHSSRHRAGASSSVACHATSRSRRPTPPKAEEAPPAPDPELIALREAMSASPPRAKLELLRALQRRSQAAIHENEQASPPRMIDARMYAGAVQAQGKIDEKLEEANLFIDVMEDKVASYDDDLAAAQEVFKRVSMEFGTTARLAEAAVQAVKFGADRQDAVAKIAKLKERLQALEKAMRKERELFSKCVPRKVPVVWVGSASEVRLVGDFDQWTRGVDLSNPEIEGDSVLRTFEATLNLLPGRYRVKFVVDGEWRLAPEWPMEKDAKGETNNVLEVK